MSQNSVYQFLSKNRGRWFSSDEVRKALKLSASTISTNLKRLRGHKMVFFKQNPKKKSTFLYKMK